MKCNLSHTTPKMRFATTLAFGLAVSAVLLGAVPMSNHATAKDGKLIFLENKCSNCHSIASQDIKGLRREGGAQPSDLSNVGTKFKSEWFEKWLLKEETLYNKRHMKRFTGSSEDLHTLALWLESLKQKK